MEKTGKDKSKQKENGRADGEAHATERQNGAEQRLPLCC